MPRTTTGPEAVGRGQALHVRRHRRRALELLGQPGGRPENVEAVRRCPAHGDATLPVSPPVASKFGLIPSACGLGLEALVLVGAHRFGLVDEHHRDPVDDAVAAVEPGVVKRFLVGEVEEGPLVLRAGEKGEELRVEGHTGHLSWS